MKEKIINKLKGKKYSIIGIILVFISAELWATNTSKVPLYLLNIMFVIGIILIIISSLKNIYNELKDTADNK